MGVPDIKNLGLLTELFPTKVLFVRYFQYLTHVKQMVILFLARLFNVSMQRTVPVKTHTARF